MNTGTPAPKPQRIRFIYLSSHMLVDHVPFVQQHRLPHVVGHLDGGLAEPQHLGVDPEPDHWTVLIAVGQVYIYLLSCREYSPLFNATADNNT